MALGNARAGRAWYPEKRSPGSRDRRFWDLGADLDPNGSLRIYRKACGASALGNKGLVIHQMDTEKNPIGLEIIQEGSGNAIEFRESADETGNAVGRIDANGSVTAASSEVLKENFKPMNHKSIEKILNNLEIKSWNYKRNPKERFVGPTAENFQKATGYGDGQSVGQTTLIGLTTAMVQFIWKRLQKLEERVGSEEKDQAKAAKEALKNADDLPEA